VNRPVMVNLQLTCIAAFLTAATGCDSSPLLPVAGQVTLDGQPLTTGFVVFHPLDGEAIPARQLPRGEIDREGKYHLTSGVKPGAPPGRYRVVVVAQDRERRAPNPRSAVHPEPLPLVDRKYFDAGRTPLEAEVRADAPVDAYYLTVSAFAGGSP